MSVYRQPVSVDPKFRESMSAKNINRNAQIVVDRARLQVLESAFERIMEKSNAGLFSTNILLDPSKQPIYTPDFAKNVLNELAHILGRMGYTTKIMGDYKLCVSWMEELEETDEEKHFGFPDYIIPDDNRR